MTYKKFILAILSLTVIWILVIAGVNFVIDPIQFYRKAFYSPLYSNDLSYQIAGLAKNYDYDTAIIGSSTSQNFLTSYINQTLGVKALKLALDGATAREQFLILNLAIKTGKVKKAIWGLDYYALSGDRNKLKEHEGGQLPYFLYDDNALNDLNYLINFRTSIDTIKNILKIGQNTDIELLGNHFFDKYDKKLILEDWKETINSNRAINERDYSMENLTNNFNEKVLKLIENKNIQFYIFYPPYSILNHKAYYKKNPILFKNELAIKKYIFDKIGAYPNVKIYDFQSDREITFNFNNYKDILHFSPKVNEYIIDSIAAGKNLVTKNNIDSLQENLRHQVEEVKVEEIGF